MKIVKKLLPIIAIFTATKNRCMLHGRVFVMQLNEQEQPEYKLSKISVLDYTVRI